MAIYLIIILGIFIVTFLSFRIGDIFSPWFITTGIWLAVTESILQLCPDLGSLYEYNGNHDLLCLSNCQQQPESHSGRV